MIRASDNERQQAVDQLKAAAKQGRLNLEELQHRCVLAFAAATQQQLQTLFEDLPQVFSAEYTTIRTIEATAATVFPS